MNFGRFSSRIKKTKKSVEGTNQKIVDIIGIYLSDPKARTIHSLDKLEFMKEITLKVPTAKLRFFMQLFKQLVLEVKDEEELVISKEHQKIVSDRIESTKEDDLLDWEEIKDDFDGI
jgi:hypothetical protein